MTNEDANINTNKNTNEFKSDKLKPDETKPAELVIGRRKVDREETLGKIGRAIEIYLAMSRNSKLLA